MYVEGSQPTVHLRGASKEGFLAKKGHLKRLRPPATVSSPDRHQLPTVLGTEARSAMFVVVVVGSLECYRFMAHHQSFSTRQKIATMNYLDANVLCRFR